jgi:hypothetical protein
LCFSEESGNAYEGDDLHFTQAEVRAAILRGTSDVEEIRLSIDTDHACPYAKQLDVIAREAEVRQKVFKLTGRHSLECYLGIDSLRALEKAVLMKKVPQDSECVKPFLVLRIDTSDSLDDMFERINALFQQDKSTAPEVHIFHVSDGFDQAWYRNVFVKLVAYIYTRSVALHWHVCGDQSCSFMFCSLLLLHVLSPELIDKDSKDRRFSLILGCSRADAARRHVSHLSHVLRLATILPPDMRISVGWETLDCVPLKGEVLRHPEFSHKQHYDDVVSLVLSGFQKQGHIMHLWRTAELFSQSERDSIGVLWGTYGNSSEECLLPLCGLSSDCPMDQILQCVPALWSVLVTQVILQVRLFYQSRFVADCSSIRAVSQRDLLPFTSPAALMLRELVDVRVDVAAVVFKCSHTNGDNLLRLNVDTLNAWLVTSVPPGPTRTWFSSSLKKCRNSLGEFLMQGSMPDLQAMVVTLQTELTHATSPTGPGGRRLVRDLDWWQSTPSSSHIVEGQEGVGTRLETQTARRGA